MVKMEQIKERGLLPVDFLKHGHDNPDAVEALYANDPTLARMSVSDPQHICNVLSDEELQMLVSQPEGSEQWFREEASACFGCPPDQFPQELIDCVGVKCGCRKKWAATRIGRGSGVNVSSPTRSSRSKAQRNKATIRSRYIN